MRKSVQTGEWYGDIRAARGNIIVIKDVQLPKANNGRIYLYNTQRGAFVEYDESIVSPKLFELDPEQTKEAKMQFQAGWEVAYKQFMRSHGKFSDNNNKEVAKKVEEIGLSDENDIDDDSIDDD